MRKRILGKLEILFLKQLDNDIMLAKQTKKFGSGRREVFCKKNSFKNFAAWRSRHCSQFQGVVKINCEKIDL